MNRIKKEIEKIENIIIKIEDELSEAEELYENETNPFLRKCWKEDIEHWNYVLEMLHAKWEKLIRYNKGRGIIFVPWDYEKKNK